MQGDIRVVATVKQHGFTVVKGGLAAVLPIREASRAEEAGEGWPDPLLEAPSVPQTLLSCARIRAGAPPVRGASLRWGLPPSARVEVVGCSHVRPEVRRLVQGVARGLLAHQVRVPMSRQTSRVLPEDTQQFRFVASCASCCVLTHVFLCFHIWVHCTWHFMPT